MADATALHVVDLGRMGFLAAWEEQRRAAEPFRQDTLFLVEHDPVVTLGASHHLENLLVPPQEFARRGIAVERVDRGGDVTFHGPGQLVAYPVFDVAQHGRDLHKWLRDLEEVVIRSLAAYGLEGYRFPPHTGVWVQVEGEPRKIAAIGVKVRRWVSTHGIAVNVENDLSLFDLIVPCGIPGYGVTSLTEATGRRVTVEDYKAPLRDAFQSVFF
ncbi:MAG: lipoyl(octanoyl) transferase LipB [Fimbriimonadaceae bacterium]|nr:lipoyl(octanoyl) transferase LipB [Fimbriimonadaceae bacterium]QYK55922.1 MAG: lipoyl(octanoyl) transferase LipB [Fimbriimonadaceae bacterium]